ncbi:MAG: hypothetical protein KC729_08305, partial [Candidatus Eisenbacteria bacterium]|nr:hypothetical protein [Candidatus Eisenbacteria bacterium]
MSDRARPNVDSSAHVRFVCASGHRARIGAARDFIRTDGSLLLVGASREAADELTLEATGTGATFGIHRFSPSQLAARLARDGLAERGWAPAGSLAVEAVAARITHEAASAGELSRLGPVSRYPGFARALGRTLVELRMAEADAPESASAWPEGSEIAGLLRRFVRALEEGRLAD